MKKNSNQRITKIKRDLILDLLKKAESISVEDGTTVQPVGSNLVPYPDMNNLYKWTRNYLLKGINKVYPVLFTDDGQTYLTAIIDGLPLFTKMSKTLSYTQTVNNAPQVVEYETSKPGLWLSNLVQPISNSFAGAWLRHNLINGDYYAFEQANQDTIGNYSFSFAQRGIFKRTAGSVHHDDDSYCQHWSPSALSSISHDGMIIPLMNLRSDYTLFQTLAVPSNPDMQNYKETSNKNITYNFVDNLSTATPVITQFNGRVVGDNWSYELVFTPNGTGSGNDYGSGSNPGATNGSNGGCLTGTITYQLPTGETCTQNVNSCYITPGALVNSSVPQNSNNQPMNLPGGWSTVTYSRTCSCSPINTFSLKASYRWIKGINITISNDVSASSRFETWSTSGCSSSPNSTQTSCYPDHSPNSCLINNPGSLTVTKKGATGSPETKAVFTVNNFSSPNISTLIRWTPGSTSGCTSRKITAQVVMSTQQNNPDTAQTNINLYINMIDNMKRFNEMGLPWTGDCSVDRFQFQFSTEVCDQSYCTSLLVAENISINALGDISLLNEKIFSRL